MQCCGAADSAVASQQEGPWIGRGTFLREVWIVHRFPSTVQKCAFLGLLSLN